MVILKLKFALRNIVRSDIFTYLNIVGLTVALCTIMAIYIYVNSEIAADKHFPEGESIYRIVREVEEPNSSFQSPTLAGPFFEIISLEIGVPLSDILRIYQDDELVSYKEQVFFESNILYVDQNFFRILEYTFKFGNPDNALQETNSTVISERIAKKYFGDHNPIGEILEIEGKGLLEVTGVLAKSTSKSHLDIDFVVNNGAMGYASRFLTDKESHALTFYLKIPEKNRTLIENNLNVLTQKFLNKGENSPKTSLSLQPLSEIYFDEPMISDIARHGNWSLIQTLIAIAIILLLLIAANFVNLSIAKLSRGVRQIGLKMALGSSRRSLIMDWALEVYMMTFLASLVGAAGCHLILPLLSESYKINLLELDKSHIVFLLFGFPILLTVIIMVIPGLMFSSLNSCSALSGKFKQLKTNLVQQTLLFFQFSVAFILIVFTIVIVRQFQYMQEKEIGLDDNQVLIFNSNNKHSWKNKTHIKNAIMQLSEVKDVSMTYGGIPTSPTEAYSYKIDQSAYQWNTAFLQPNLIELLDLKILDGKNFDDRISSEVHESILLNESAAKTLGWPQQDLIGKYVTVSEDSLTKKILGIIQDYHYESFKHKIEPLVIQSTGWEETFVVKLAGKDYQTVLSEIESIWKNYVPKYPFSYHFLDESFQNMHLEDTKNGKVIFFFTILTIIIASMGTLGLGALIQQSKIKEITIRKVLGAPLHSIYYLLGANFLKVLLLSNLLAIPATWIFTTNWLNDFNYRIQLSPIFFIIGFALLIVIIMILIIAQSWETATSNPIKNLRVE